MSETKERRFYTGEVRAISDETSGVTIIRGSAAVFNSLSENLGGFREIILPGAFDSCLNNDVRALFNHDANFILGRTTSGTLTLSQTDEGLIYEIKAPDTQTVKDMVLSPLARGDLSQSSFQFVIASDGERWYKDEEGRVIREISKCSRLFDVGPVTFPAYPDTTSAKRSMDAFLEETDLAKASTSKRSRERMLAIVGVGG